MEEIIGSGGDDLVIAVVERDLNFPQDDFCQAGNFESVQRERAITPERFERVMIPSREIISTAAQVGPELFAVQFALAFGAGVDANFVVVRRINDDVVAFGTE